MLSLESTFSQNESAQAYYLKGKELLAKGEYEDANKAFKKAEELLEKENKTKEAILPFVVSSEVKGSLQLTSPREEEKENILQDAKVAYLNNEFDKAVKLYSKASKLYPKEANIYYNLGVLYLRKREYLNAAEAFEKALSLNPKDADAYYNLGIIYESFLNDRRKALKCYKNYLRFGSKNVDTERVKKWIAYIKREEFNFK